MRGSAMDELILTANSRYTTYFEHESGYSLPCDQVEEYIVSYKGLLVATFWVSNHLEDSIRLHCPTDIRILERILELQRTRSFKGEA